MKKITLIILLLACIQSYSQITVDFETSTVNLVPIQLSNSETKYLDAPAYWYANDDYFKLYNLDGSLYKTIQMPAKPDSASYIEIVDFVTTSLFDNDPSNIEYLVHYDPCDSTLSGAPWRVKIIREDGTVLLDEPYASYSDIRIYHTEEGVKLMLPYYSGNSMLYKKVIYSLPGELPSGLGEISPNDYTDLSIYPNPNKGAFLINLNSKQGESATIDIYTVTGKLIKSFKSDSNFFQVDKSGLSNGLYIINTTTTQGNSSAKMIIQK